MSVGTSSGARPELGATRVDGSGSPYGRPIIKEPVWTWEIPVYFYAGGLAGASAGLGALAELRGNDVLARRAFHLALGGAAVSPALLISDLGRPERFLHMLRMFKVTSPMSVGSWVLSAFGGAAALGWLDQRLSSSGTARGRAARGAAALLGLPLSSYTAALVTNTAVPAWHETRRLLPFVFVSGAAASAGGAATAMTPIRHAGPARRLAVGGAVTELVTKEVMERTLGDLSDAYEEGLPHRLGIAGKTSVAAGAALIALRGRRSRAAAAVGGTLLNIGAMLARWSVFEAGSKSAADPRHTVGPQRERIAS